MAFTQTFNEWLKEHPGATIVASGGNIDGNAPAVEVLKNVTVQLPDKATTWTGGLDEAKSDFGGGDKSVGMWSVVDMWDGVYIADSPALNDPESPNYPVDPMAESVYTLERLAELANARRALVCPLTWGKNYKPAAFIMNMTGRQIMQLFKAGLFVREKPTKTKKPKTLPAGWESDFPGGLPPGERG